MSKRHKPLEDTFNLPSLDELNEDFDESDDDEEYDDYDGELSGKELEEHIANLKKELAAYDEIGMISTKNTENYNKDIDELYKTAKDGYTEIFNAALVMEPAQGAKFLNGAAKLLEIALRSKNSSMEKQLDMAKLQLERERMNKGKSVPKDINDSDDEENYDATNYGKGDNGGNVYDRNELVERMKNKNKNKDEE